MSNLINISKGALETANQKESTSIGGAWQLDKDVIPAKVGEAKEKVGTGDRNVLSKFDLSRVPDHVRDVVPS